MINHCHWILATSTGKNTLPLCYSFKLHGGYVVFVLKLSCRMAQHVSPTRSFNIRNFRCLISLSVLSLGSVKTGLAKFCGFGQFFLPPCHAACFWRSPSLTSRRKFGVPNRSRRHPSRRMSRYVSWTFLSVFWSWKLRNWSFRRSENWMSKRSLNKGHELQPKVLKRKISTDNFPFPRKTDIDNRPALQRKGSSSNPGPFPAGEVLVLGSVYCIPNNYPRDIRCISGVDDIKWPSIPRVLPPVWGQKSPVSRCPIASHDTLRQFRTHQGQGQGSQWGCNSYGALMRNRKNNHHPKWYNSNSGRPSKMVKKDLLRFEGGETLTDSGNS